MPTRDGKLGDRNELSRSTLRTANLTDDTIRLAVLRVCHQTERGLPREQVLEMLDALGLADYAHAVNLTTHLKDRR